MDEQIGVINPSADIVPREDETWSDNNLDDDFSKYPDAIFTRLVCRNCHQHNFEVLSTGSYQTSARCLGCGMYYIVHSG